MSSLTCVGKAQLMDSESHRRRERLAKKANLEWNRFHELYMWIEHHLIIICGGQIKLAYKDWSRDRGRCPCPLAEEGYILTSPIDDDLDRLLDFVEAEEEIHDDFARIWTNRYVYRDIIDDIVLKAKIDSVRKLGPLKANLEPMVAKCKAKAQQARRMSMY